MEDDEEKIDAKFGLKLTNEILNPPRVWDMDFNLVYG
jgi:hypothetical protein